MMYRFIPSLSPKFPSIVCLWWIISFPAFTTKFFIKFFLIAAKQFVLSILSHSSLVTFEFSCFCWVFLFQIFSYLFKSFGLDAILPSQFIFSSMFDFIPPTFKPILNLTQIFRSLARSSSIHLFQYGCLNSFLLATTPTWLHINLIPALKRFFSSSKFFVFILQIISLTSETVLLTFKASIRRSKGIVPSIPPSVAGWFSSTLTSITGVTSEPSTGSFSINTSTLLCGSLLFASKPLFQLLAFFSF